MTARALVGNAVAFRADPAVHDARSVGAVHREEGPDAVLIFALAEKMTDAAKVARPFFSDIAHEQDIVASAYLVVLQRAGVGCDYRQAARVVADARRVKAVALAAHLHVRFFREHRVEMRSNDHDRSARPAGAAVEPHCVALRVDLDVLKTGLPQHVAVGGGALGFLERRRGNFGERDDVLHDPVVLAVELRGRRLVCGAGEHPLRHAIARAGDGGERRGGGSDQGKESSHERAFRDFET